MKKYLIICLFALGALEARAAGDDTTAVKNAVPEAKQKKHKPFFNNVQIRESFQTPDAQENPAQFALSIPSSGRNNWLVDGGISVNLGHSINDIWTSKLIGEFHRNTLIDSAQYNYQLGYSLIHFHDLGNNHWSKVWTTSIKYVRDVIDTGNSVAASVNFALYYPGSSFALGKPGYLGKDDGYTYQLLPSAELQYQQFLSSDKHATGTILRPLFNLVTSIALNRPADPKAGLVARSKMLELQLTYVNRYALINNTGNHEGYTKLLKTALNYYFVNNGTATISLGASYNLGSDPLSGLKAQQYWQFGLQIQL